MVGPAKSKVATTTPAVDLRRPVDLSQPVDGAAPKQTNVTAPAERQRKADTTIGVVAHADDTKHGNAVRTLALKQALGALHAVCDKLESVDISAHRQERTKLISRLKQTIATLERLDVSDPKTAAMIEQFLPRLDAHGGGISFKGLVDKLRALLPGGGKATQVAKVEVPQTEVQRLSAYLGDAVAAFNAKDYKTVRKMLTDKDAAHSFGMSLNVSCMLMRCDPATLTAKEIDSLILQIRMSSMSFDTGKVDMVDVGFIDFDNPQSDGGIEANPELAEKALPIMLEEWMHQLQRKQDGPCSKLTEAYIKDTGIPFEALHEMDIQASFREWGFDVDTLGTVHAYKERGDFERWYQAKKTAGELQ